MPLTDENRGTNVDGSRSEDYCVYCYKNGEFTQEFTMTQMIEFCLQFFDQWNVQAECKLTPSQCENVTVVSIDANGYPRPVQMSKIGARGFHEVWMATCADSVKVNDFKANNKAGLCYDYYGDGVALRGTVEVVTNETIRKEMWKDWFIHHFPGGASDPNYVLLHFTGTEATFWINGEYSHSNI